MESDCSDTVKINSSWCYYLHGEGPDAVHATKCGIGGCAHEWEGGWEEVVHGLVQHVSSYHCTYSKHINNDLLLASLRNALTKRPPCKSPETSPVLINNRGIKIKPPLTA